MRIAEKKKRLRKISWRPRQSGKHGGGHHWGNAFCGNGNAEGLPTTEMTTIVGAGTSDERIEAAFTDMNAALRSELPERVQTIHRTAFEKLIVDLMLGISYGAGGSGQHLGRTNDGGVDGIINEDVLGLDIIYRQAPSGSFVSISSWAYQICSFSSVAPFGPRTSVITSIMAWKGWSAIAAMLRRRSFCQA